MRKLLRGIGFVIVSLVLLYGYMVWQNNISVTPPERAGLEATLENSIQWLEKNRDAVLTIENPMLWYMIQQAADISGDQRLFADYEQRYLQGRHDNIWRPLFYPGTWVPVRFEDIASFDYYNWHSMYASICDSELGKVPEIAAQNAPAFCDSHPLRPACATHQLMGIRLMQRIECGDADQLDNAVKQLQQRIRRQLLLDIRVVDVYMQRVLMLTESDARDLINAQQSDGGWGPFEPLLPLGGGLYFGYGPRFFEVKQPSPTFHMTAQGVLLFALLTNSP